MCVIVEVFDLLNLLALIVLSGNTAKVELGVPSGIRSCQIIMMDGHRHPRK